MAITVIVNDIKNEWVILKVLSMYWWKLEISIIYWRMDNFIVKYFAPINNINKKECYLP